MRLLAPAAVSVCRHVDERMLHANICRSGWRRLPPIGPPRIAAPVKGLHARAHTYTQTAVLRSNQLRNEATFFNTLLVFLVWCCVWERISSPGALENDKILKFCGSPSGSRAQRDTVRQCFANPVCVGFCNNYRGSIGTRESWRGLIHQISTTLC